jgi:hypothetical protein
MFFTKQNLLEQKEYENFLKIAGCLSNLFSDSEIPYLYYRLAEKAFCRAFNAEDLSRSDVSADAKKGTLGIGLKTFLKQNDFTLQKVAEFNAERSNYSNLSPLDLSIKISQLRNQRILLTKNIHGLTSAIYHCIVRDIGKFKVFEEEMDMINIEAIKDIKKQDNSIKFKDDKNEYSFSISKSTLYKRFNTKHTVHEFDIEILQDPLLELRNFINKTNVNEYDNTSKVRQTVYLPLYGKDMEVAPKSGLNQWNAGGRARDANEVYIPIPAIIHKNFQGFFPSRDISFSLKLPNGKNMKAKVCQDGNKALMSYSNKELGQWILRDILKLQEGELLTYQKLQDIGIDSVRIDKTSQLEFEINFAKLGSYEDFKETFILR